MTKHDLIAAIAAKSGTTKAAAERFIAVFTAVAAEELARKDGCIELNTFGALRAVPRHERKGRDPRTGEAIVIPAYRQLVFRPGRALREAVNA